MAADRRLIWDSEVLTSSTGEERRIIAPTEKFGDTVVVPKVAEVRLQASAPGWGGYEGTTYFVEQHPPASGSGPRTGILEFSYTTDGLFARMASINTDGTFWPPELPKILEFVEKNWGWKVNPLITRGLRDPKHK